MRSAWTCFSLLFALIACTILVLAMAWTKRHWLVLFRRNAKLVFIMVLVQISFVVWVFAAPSLGCGLFALPASMLSAVFLIVCLARTLDLSDPVHLKLLLLDSVSTEQHQFKQEIHPLTKPFANLALFSLIMIVPIYQISIRPSSAISSIYSAECREMLLPFSYNLLAWYSAQTVALITLTYLHRSTDTYSASSESLLDFTIGFLMAVVGWASLLSSAEDTCFALLVFGGICLLVTSLLLPLRRSKHSAGATKEVSSNSKDVVSDQDDLELSPATKPIRLDELKLEFKYLLHDAEGYEAFASFLVSEWSVENLLFWKETEEFRRLYEVFPEEQAFEKAFHIYSLYLKTDAELSVNVSGACRKAVKQHFHILESPRSSVLPRVLKSFFKRSSASKSVTAGQSQRKSSVFFSMAERSSKLPSDFQSEFAQSEAGSRLSKLSDGIPEIPVTIFDRANDEIFRLMLSDSFGRFRCTQVYSDFKEVNVLDCSP